MNILVTGSQGFIGKNLVQSIKDTHEVIEFTSEMKLGSIKKKLSEIDFIFHFAGVNRDSNKAIIRGNHGFTRDLCNLLATSKVNVPLLISSSTQAENTTVYGKSKLSAENELIKLSKTYSAPIYIYRLPNVFGKWSKPNYNSVVSTFCYNILNGLPININDPSHKLNLVYIDDVIKEFTNLLKNSSKKEGIFYRSVKPVYSITLGLLAKKIFSFQRSDLMLPRTSKGIDRALYSTYLSYKKPEQFSYKVNENIDNRGKFVELFHTQLSGQFSFFTSKPGITRGLHYHHTKNEKFIVLKGKAKFKFRNLNTNEKYSMECDDSRTAIIETVPGWVHSITNTGDQELVVLLWANEIFNLNLPDTFQDKI